MVAYAPTPRARNDATDGPQIVPAIVGAGTSPGPAYAARTRFWQEFQARKLLDGALLRSATASIVLAGTGLLTGRVYIGDLALVFMQDDVVAPAGAPAPDGPPSLIRVAAYSWLGPATLDVARLGVSGLVTFGDGTVLRMPKPAARLIHRLSSRCSVGGPACSWV